MILSIEATLFQISLTIAIISAFWLSHLIGYERGWYDRTTNKKHKYREK